MVNYRCGVWQICWEIPAFPGKIWRTLKTKQYCTNYAVYKLFWGKSTNQLSENASMTFAAALAVTEAKLQFRIFFFTCTVTHICTPTALSFWNTPLQHALLKVMPQQSLNPAKFHSKISWAPTHTPTNACLLYYFLFSWKCIQKSLANSLEHFWTFGGPKWQLA